MEEGLPREVAQLVEDGLALVDFDSAQLALAVRIEGVGPVVDRRVRQFDEKVGRFARFGAGRGRVVRHLPVVRVNVGDDEIGEVLGAPHFAGIGCKLARANRVRVVRVVAGHVVLVVQPDPVPFVPESAGAGDGIQSRKQLGRDLLGLAKRVQRLLGDRYRPLDVQGVRSRVARRILARVPCVPEGIRRDAEKADPPLRGVEELGALRFGEVPAPAGRHDAHALHVVHGLSQPCDPEVRRVVVREVHQVETDGAQVVSDCGPGQGLEDVRVVLGQDLRGLGDVLLEIAERHVSLPEDRVDRLNLRDF